MKPTFLLIATLLAGSTPFESPDLCQESVLLNPATGEPVTDSTGTNLSTSCAWTGPDAPVWDDEACCTIDAAGTACMAPNERGLCPTGFSPYYCEYGEEFATGLVCYQSIPSACDYSNCDQSTTDLHVEFDEPLNGDAVCCILGVCYEWDDLLWEDCEGEFGWCDDGYSNLDGTVECFD